MPEALSPAPGERCKPSVVVDLLLTRLDGSGVAVCARATRNSSTMNLVDDLPNTWMHSEHSQGKA